MAKALIKTYQLKITLNDSKPPIWRQFLIKDSVTLAKLHDVIQIVMGWTNSHLHQFIEGNQFFGVPDPDIAISKTRDEKKTRLSQLLKKEKASIIYEYDFGDGWEHILTLEKILPFDPEAVLPQCINAKGACPPEDIGGIWGYYNFLEALTDPNHPEHEDYKGWLDGEAAFDPDAYDLDEVNDLLAKYCR